MEKITKVIKGKTSNNAPRTKNQKLRTEKKMKTSVFFLRASPVRAPPEGDTPEGDPPLRETPSEGDPPKGDPLFKF